MKLYFIEELNIENPRSIEFQGIHRLGKKRAGQARSLIARFLRFPERELVFKNVRDLGEESEVKVYADYPSEIQQRRKKLWPKMKKAREEGRQVFFYKQQPDKLFIDGVLCV